jgi:prepilin-type N-terminal cleavage/methylation domain-containing protein
LFIALESLGFARGDFDDLERHIGVPTAAGYSMAQLDETARAWGASTIAVDTSLENLVERKEPFACITLVDDNHFVLLYDVDESNVFILDYPDSRQISRDAFSYKWSHKALLLARTPLQTEESITRARQSSIAIRWSLGGAVALVGVVAATLLIRTRASGRGAQGARDAFTLIEVLVVVTVIGIVIALAIPAIQGAREASRRVACINNLKQIGLALESHASARGEYPAGIMPHVASTPGHRWAIGPLSAHVQLLPYLEHIVLFNEINWAPHPSATIAPVSEAPENATARGIALAAFICPSDSSPPASGCNYRACVGPLPSEMDGARPPGGGGGAFPGLVAMRPSSIRDGTSHTAAFSERLRGSGLLGGFDSTRDIWFSGIADIAQIRDGDDMIQACRSLKNAAPDAWTRAGESWIQGRYTDTLYNHVAPPNARGPDCSANGRFGLPGDMSTVAMSARSAHPSGVAVLMLDGAVRFVRESASLPLWRAIASREGGEPVGLEDL